MLHITMLSFQIIDQVGVETWSGVTARRTNKFTGLSIDAGIGRVFGVLRHNLIVYLLRFFHSYFCDPIRVQDHRFLSERCFSLTFRIR